jgi:hypothetical protein
MSTTFGHVLATPGTLTDRYAKGLLKDLTPATFARLPVAAGKTIQTNHPAWAYGHNALYYSRVVELCGGVVRASKVPDGFDPLFKNGSSCLDDPAGTIYPAMDTIVSFHHAALAEAIDALRNAKDATLLEAYLKDGKPHDFFPTKGAAATFLLGAHPMSHLGQVSAWRRFMGLGSAF